METDTADNGRIHITLKLTLCGTGQTEQCCVPAAASGRVNIGASAAAASNITFHLTSMQFLHGFLNHSPAAFSSEWLHHLLRCSCFFLPFLSNIIRPHLCRAAWQVLKVRLITNSASALIAELCHGQCEGFFFFPSSWLDNLSSSCEFVPYMLGHGRKLLTR